MVSKGKLISFEKKKLQKSILKLFLLLKLRKKRMKVEDLVLKKLSSPNLKKCSVLSFLEKIDRLV